ncbi:MAG: ATP-binding protein [Leptolyngbyaceae cyanobacterium MAG.088]|nr:ATP-binding protein [Leptolyngbyaceae cyanobacterium MAG.088]
MYQIFGDYIDILPPDRDSLELSFTSSSEDIKNLWKNQRLSAHFLANCFINFLPLDENTPEEEQRIKEAQGSISYVANELIENAMKFNLETAAHQVKLGIYFLENPELVAVVFATNSVDQIQAQAFQAFIKELLGSDPQELYISQVESSATDDSSTQSGLGFLTMINDYQARLGWKFEPLLADVIAVTVMAQINV